jgi:hypothetical protein
MVATTVFRREEVVIIMLHEAEMRNRIISVREAV